MSGAEWAIAISLVSLVAQLVNAWLNQRMRAELAELQLKIFDRMDEHYVPREICILRHQAGAQAGAQNA